MSEEKSEMKAPAAKQQMVAARVRIRANQTIGWTDPETQTFVTLAKGQEADVPEEIAREFCDRKFQGSYAFSGERYGADTPRHTVVRASKVS